MTFLLDVNVLIALIDPSHVSHGPALDWFDATGNDSWATCPITENGVVRIVGNSSYANSPGTTAAVAELMREFVALPGHIFWPDDISLLDSAKVEASRLLTTAQVTDSYLLALACAHGGSLATLDRRLIADAVAGGHDCLYVI
jgi:toxin-antitoxin system PIN domain toxin